MTSAQQGAATVSEVVAGVVLPGHYELPWHRIEIEVPCRNRPHTVRGTQHGRRRPGPDRQSVPQWPGDNPGFDPRQPCQANYVFWRQRATSRPPTPMRLPRPCRQSASTGRVARANARVQQQNRRRAGKARKRWLLNRAASNQSDWRRLSRNRPDVPFARAVTAPSTRPGRSPDGAYALPTPDARRLAAPEPRPPPVEQTLPWLSVPRELGR